MDINITTFGYNAEITWAAIRQWWNAPSESFSWLAGEDFTHGQVITANLCFILGLVAIMAAVAILNQLFGIGGAL